MRKIYGPLLALALVPGLAAQVFGTGVAVARIANASPGAPPPTLGYDEVRVPNFDPVRDVPTMPNWNGVWSDSFGGHCFAIATLTNYFFQRIEFVAEATPGALPVPGSPGDEGSDAQTPMGRWESSDKLGWSLATSRRAEKIQVAGPGSLREFTAPGSPGEAWFRYIAEAAHMHMQTTTEWKHMGGSLLKVNLGSIPLVGRLPFLGGDAVNKDGVNIIRDRIQEGRPVVFSMNRLKGTGGHVVLAYTLRDYSDRVEVICYDMNRAPALDVATGEVTPDPLVLTFGRDDWKFEARATKAAETGGASLGGGEVRYARYEIITVLDPGGRASRRKFRKIATNPEESHQRNSGAAQAVGNGGWRQRLGGATRFVGEVLNPF